MDTTFYFYNSENGLVLTTTDRKNINFTLDGLMLNWSYQDQEYQNIFIQSQMDEIKYNGRIMSIRPWMKRPNRFTETIPSHSVVLNNGNTNTLPDSEVPLKLITMSDEDVSLSDLKAVSTGSECLDYFWSNLGGVISSSLYLSTGKPGSGKSSFFVYLLNQLKKENPKLRVIYLSSLEMDRYDVLEITQYYPGANDNIEFLYLEDYILDDIPVYQVVEKLLDEGVDYIVLDSLIEIQSAIAEELKISVKQAENWLLIRLLKAKKGFNKKGTLTTIFSLQQHTKGGDYVGGKRQEHLMTGFIEFQVDKKTGEKSLVFIKNRKNSKTINIPLYYDFTDGAGLMFDEDRYKSQLRIKGILEDSASHSNNTKYLTQEQLLEMISTQNVEEEV